MYRCKACNKLMSEEEAQDDVIGWDEYNSLCQRCLGSLVDYNIYDYNSCGDEDDEEDLN